MHNIRATTDRGTVVFHALLLATYLVTLATGLRIGTDDPQWQVLGMLDAVLPVENLWFRHLVAGLAVAALLAGCRVYVARAGLGARTRMDRARLIAMFSRSRSRWAAINVLAFKLLLWSLATLAVSGVLVFAGSGRGWLVVHMWATFLSVGAILAHVGLHAASGGAAQLLRIVRPSRLEIAPPPPDLADLLADVLARQADRQRPAAEPSPPRREPAPGAGRGRVRERVRSGSELHAHPLATGLAVVLATVMLGLGAEQATRPTLAIAEITSAEHPRIDGEISDPAWAKAVPASVLTTQGGDFGGTHQSLVEIRAVHDGEYAYFAIVWEDPTRSLKHRPLLKRDGRWFVVADNEQLVDEQTYNEDKLAVLLTRPGRALIGAAIHLAARPLADRPPGATGRGLHYTEGGIADIWLWRAAHAGVVGHIDNCHFGAPVGGSEMPDAPPSSYPGGFEVDPGPPAYQWNAVTTTSADGAPLLLPRRLPRDPADAAAHFGHLAAAPGESEPEDARAFLTERETEPYSPALDARFPDGTVLPSIVVASELALTKASIRGVARWAAGRWTLELVRRLYTGSPDDVPIKSGAMLWVAAFDHAEKRHTRHLRPFVIEVE
ncbi:MAG: ethylbenzene dehydrogenase-related protein [Hyphomicrobiaceae bacterium]